MFSLYFSNCYVYCFILVLVKNISLSCVSAAQLSLVIVAFSPTLSKVIFLSDLVDILRLCCHQAVIRQLSGSYQTVVRQLSDRCQAVVRQSSNCNLLHIIWDFFDRSSKKCLNLTFKVSVQFI